MALLFVYGDFVRSGKLHNVMKGFPFLASAEVSGEICTCQNAPFLIEKGTDVVSGEVYDLPEDIQGDFLHSLSQIYETSEIVFKPITAKARGSNLLCHYFTLGECKEEC
ncbi:MAG: gamma-glutamylcyclotransferase [Brevinema sp.]